MQKSLFKKLFIMSLAIVAAAMIIMGIILFTFFRNFWISEKRTALRSGINTVSVQLDQMEGVINYEHQVKRLLGAVSDSTGGEVFITDMNGTVISASDWKYVGKTVPKAAIETAQTDEYSETGTLGMMIAEPSYIIGSAFEVDGHAVSCIFISSPYSELGIYMFNIMRIFLIAAFIVFIIAFCAVYLVSMHMVRPIREMAAAARRMSYGDFTKLIRVDRKDEIGELAEDFNTMTKSLSAGESVRRGFVANVSHELKTPMTTISGFIDGILDGTIPECDREKYLNIVSNEVKRLSRLVVSMLNLSKLESGEMKISPVRIDLTQLTVDIALGFEQRINEKEIDIRGLETLGECYMTADRDLMHQAIYNLVDNAIKYAPKGGYILFGSKVDDNKVSMSIRNSGAGIPESELKNIFDRFYKIDKSRGTDKSGAGLGLFLVKNIISLLGGTITVNSVEGEYTEFVYTLTVQPVEKTTDSLPVRA